MRRSLFIIALVVFFALAFARTSITVYTSVPAGIMTEIEEAFEKTHPDIDLIVWRSGTSKVAAKLLAEMQAGKIQADIVWTADPSYFVYLKKKNLLMKYVSPEAINVPDLFKDEDGYFTGTRIMSVVIAYNTDLMKREDVPKDWQDLAESRYKNSIVTASPLYSGTNLVWVYTMVKLYGWDFLEKLADNGLTIVESNKTVSQELAAGSYKVAVVLDYMIRSLKSQGSHVDYLYLDKNNVLIWSPIGIIATTEHPEEAKKFVDFVLSKEGQKILVEQESLISVRSDIPVPEGVPSLEELLERSCSIDWADLEEETENIKDQFSDIFE